MFFPSLFLWESFGLLVVFDLFVSFFEPLSLDVFELLEPLPVLELFSFLSVVKTVCTSSKLIFWFFEVDPVNFVTFTVVSPVTFFLTLNVKHTASTDSLMG